MPFSQIPPDPIKICLLGDVGVGKSSVILKYTQDYFPTEFYPNVEDTYFKDIKLGDKSYRLTILDTAPQEDLYSPLREIQFTEAEGFLIMFRVDSLESYTTVTDQYNHILRVKGKLPPIILVGNKTDLDLERIIDADEASRLANALNFIGYIETSAKYGSNIEDVFLTLAQSIINERNGSTLNDQNDSNSNIVEDERSVDGRANSNATNSNSNFQDSRKSLQKYQTFTTSGYENYENIRGSGSIQSTDADSLQKVEEKEDSKEAKKIEEGADREPVISLNKSSQSKQRNVSSSCKTKSTKKRETKKGTDGKQEDQREKGSKCCIIM
ncbi:hypothetical protein WICMUC_003901 [Wickerhamomyces mucosus]|uniref:Uncharacterized protein n=1 Tax=Wickerhamomyces mucosus TaxID=1378264 RepID=A0A9P8TB50_9ASCO|nr:hypothetical protein WICMUC_003901 [Wickerhamomyces mucosus]